MLDKSENQLTELVRSRNYLVSEIADLVEGEPVPSVLSALSRVMIHICLTTDFPKHRALEAFTQQWDAYEREHRSL